MSSDITILTQQKNKDNPGAKTKIIKGGLLVAGTFFLGIGILGIFLPILPTTVFLLLAAYCYSRSSDKFYNWLINNKWFGKYITNYREKKGMSAGAKVFSISLLWISILYSVIYVIQNPFIRVLLILIASGVSIHIFTIRTYRELKTQEAEVLNSNLKPERNHKETKS